MQKFLIIVKFASIDHFCQFYRELSSGIVFLPSGKPLPENSRILLQIWIPGVKTSFLLPGEIRPTDAGHNDSSGMTADVRAGLPRLLPVLNQALTATEPYPNLLFPFLTKNVKPGTVLEDVTDLEIETDEDLLHLEMENAEHNLPETYDLESPPAEVSSTSDALEFRLQTDDEEIQINKRQTHQPSAFYTPPVQGSDHHSGILFDVVKQMVNQVEFEREIAPPVNYVSKKILEKKDLTSEERVLAEPVGKFFMNLTKAILRSGYYDPGHPSSQSAKKGLYDEFIAVMGECREIMITHQASREGSDIMLTGILDEPVSIRQLVGPGVAELFVPKLSGYCDKKRLLSFAVKQNIIPDHFYDFIDIMSDPKVDTQDAGEAGNYLTSALIAHNISEISAIFIDDMVKLETVLPWRVEMAIHRLAKDLKILPMFKGVSSESVKNLKLQTVKDIIRPLKFPQYLNDFLVNCYLIAKYVDTMRPEDIEEMIVAAFSLDLLLPTAQFTFKELDALNQLKSEKPDNAQIQRRLAGIQRILKLIARRVVNENISGARRFLQDLHNNHIITFDELPAEVQYFIHSDKMAEDVRNHFAKYEDALGHLKDPEEALVYLQCFRRVAVVFAESDRWDMISRMAETLKVACPRKPLNSESVHSRLKITRKEEIEDFSGSSLFQSLLPDDRPMSFVFKDIADPMILAYGSGDAHQRRILDHIMDDLGSFGTIILGRMLTDSPDREVRKQSFESLVKKGTSARNWAIATLDDPNHPWFVHRNAMMILGKISHEEDHFACARKFLDHESPKIREEVLNLIVSLRPSDAESIIIRALNDSDPKVRWRAIRSLERFSPVSESAINTLLLMISLPLPKEKDLAEQQIGKCIAIISVLAAMPSIPKPGRVESQVLETVKSIIGEKKSFWKKVAGVAGSDHETAVLKAAIPLLGKIGGDASQTFLKQTAKSYPELLEIIKKAIMRA